MPDRLRIARRQIRSFMNDARELRAEELKELKSVINTRQKMALADLREALALIAKAELRLWQVPTPPGVNEG
jgi:hypothetical protein